MSEELKPCPFCKLEESHAGPWVDWESMNDGMKPNRLYFVQAQCGAQGPLSHSKQEAIATWNQRNKEK